MKKLRVRQRNSLVEDIHRKTEIERREEIDEDKHREMLLQ